MNATSASSPASSSPRLRVLAIRHGALGDLVLGFPAFHALREFMPDAHITLMTARPFAAFADTFPWFDAVWSDARPKWWNLPGWAALAQRLRHSRFDRVYDFQNKRRTALYYRLLPAPKPEWSGSARGCSHPWQGHADPTLHQQDRYLRQLAAAGVPAAGRPDLTWLDADLTAGPAQALPARYALLLPGCAPHRPEKRWPAEHFARLGQRLAMHGVASVLAGTAAEGDALTRIASQIPGAVNLCGQTSLAQLAGLARRAATVIGNDTGPAHLAAAVGAPVLVVMSAVTNPARSAPRGPRAGWIQCPDLKDLEAETVESALRWAV